MAYSEFEATVLTLRTIWRDPIRPRLVMAMLAALAQAMKPTRGRADTD